MTARKSIFKGPSEGSIKEKPLVAEKRDDLMAFLLKRDYLSGEFGTKIGSLKITKIGGPEFCYKTNSVAKRGDKSPERLF